MRAVSTLKRDRHKHFSSPERVWARLCDEDGDALVFVDEQQGLHDDAAVRMREDLEGIHCRRGRLVCGPGVPRSRLGQS